MCYSCNISGYDVSDHRSINCRDPKNPRSGYYRSEDSLPNKFCWGKCKRWTFHIYNSNNHLDRPLLQCSKCTCFRH